MRCSTRRDRFALDARQCRKCRRVRRECIPAYTRNALVRHAIQPVRGILSHRGFDVLVHGAECVPEGSLVPVADQVADNVGPLPFVAAPSFAISTARRTKKSRFSASAASATT